MNRDFEVVVVGAGPAGSITAAFLARLGHEVLLLDQSSFPRHKTCGDALPSGVMEVLLKAGLGEKVEAAFSRGEFYPIHRMRLVSPRGYQMIIPLSKSESGYYPAVVPRYYLDLLLQQHAVEAGAVFRQLKVKGLLFEEGRVVGVRGSATNAPEKIRAGVVVGADGVNSVLARELRKNRRHTARHRALAVRAYIEDLELYPHEVEFYLYRNILPGYAWIFPTGNGRANIGLGMRLDRCRQSQRRLKTMLEDFLAMSEISKRLREGGKLRELASWPLNFGSQSRLQYAFHGAVLVGDAAGFINPLTGGGIHRSLISGHRAAGVIHEALEKKNLTRKGLQPYEIMCRKALLKSLRRSYYLQTLLHQFPGLVDFYAGYLYKYSSLARALVNKF